MPNFKDINEAQTILGLGKTATLKEIKRAYRKQAHLYHPDKHESASRVDEERMKKLNWAYKVLMDYCNEYRYSFDEQDVARTYPHEEHMRKWSEKWFDSI
jgi:DnaJ-class molecular chaperone